ncbi:hypothetical protein ACJX0J_040664, partial [Zea mays]
VLVISRYKAKILIIFKYKKEKLVITKPHHHPTFQIPCRFNQLGGERDPIVKRLKTKRGDLPAVSASILALQQLFLFLGLIRKLLHFIGKNIHKIHKELNHFIIYFTLGNRKLQL